MSRHRGLLAAVLLSAACVAFRADANATRWRRLDRHHLPAFDPYVYVVMAEDPAFFTIAPWGYRVLSPWLARSLSPADAVRGFKRLAMLGLVAAGPLLYLWLRRRGHAEWTSLLACGFFYVTPPVDEVFRNFFLAEPVGIVVMLIVLLGLRRPATLGVTAGLVLGALTKDVFVLFLPGVLVALLAERGRRGMVPAVLAAGASLVVYWGLHGYWTPSVGGGDTLVPSLASLGTALVRLVQALPSTWAPLFACGLPLAAVGAFLPQGRRFLRSHGLLLATGMALPFGAALYTGSSVPAETFYADDIPRLFMYPLPMILSLALLALEHRWPGGRLSLAPEPLAERSLSGIALHAVSGIVAVAGLLFPFAALDRYRRADLRGRTDSHYVTAFCRESLAFARRLDRGRLVTYEPVARRYLRGRSDPRHMERMRWFLRDGWGPLPQYGMEHVEMQEARATIVLPCFTPSDLDLTVVLWATHPLTLRLEVNGIDVGEAAAGPDAERQRFRIPASGLMRGDNLLSLVGADASGGVRLQLLNVRRAF